MWNYEMCPICPPKGPVTIFHFLKIFQRAYKGLVSDMQVLINISNVAGTTL